MVDACFFFLISLSFFFFKKMCLHLAAKDFIWNYAHFYMAKKQTNPIPTVNQIIVFIAYMDRYKVTGKELRWNPVYLYMTPYKGNVMLG